MGRIAGIIVIALIALLAMWGIGAYNGLITSSETVDTQWSQVENAYQRRFDLIPNLVETVKGAAEFERGTFSDVAEARSRIGQMQIDSSVVDDPSKLQAFEQAQGALSSALSRLLVAVERYPDLKATANFQSLQDELAGTENRISVERRRFNETVQQYNLKVKRFPGNVLAGLMGFDDKAYFESTSGAETAPKVEF